MTIPANFNRSLINLMNIIATIAIFVLLIISVGGFFSDLNWRLAWYSNPRPHFVFASVVALIWFLWQRNKVMSSVSFVTLIINLFVLAPLFLSPSTNVESTSTLTIAHLNTDQGQAILTDVSNINVDVLLLQEVTPELDDSLTKLFNSYDLVHSHPLTNTHGSALLIHKDIEIEVLHTEIIYLPDSSVRPLISADIKFENRLIKLLSLHIIRPHHEWADWYQQIELNAVAKWSREIQQEAEYEVVVVGDFNVTPWSDRFAKLLVEGNLNDTLRGYGLQNTWPSNFPLILGLPIDHALYSNGLATIGRSTMIVKGTDHALLLVQLALNAL